MYLRYAPDKNDSFEDNQAPELISKILQYEVHYKKDKANQYETAPEIPGQNFEKLGFSLNIAKAIFLNARSISTEEAICSRGDESFRK